ncbi:putative oxalate decarboxylase/oxidase [Mycena pura]|uniref:Oxalate decarboxylase/oxidase n=1 Tax=Mycena pura TaxID=153505 RepID=A0AAD6VTX8_9AGAR|nr:putative oxalate decarboxylase/oxidase [Mycena pura]
MYSIASCLCALSLLSFTAAAPAAIDSSSAPAVGGVPSDTPLPPVASETTSAAASTATVPFASTDPNFPLWSLDGGGNPAPIREGLGASILGPANHALDYENPDLLAPPTTDAGTVSNAKWPFALSHNRLQTGGWARQQNIDEMPISTSMASVNMRLEAGAIRELHWHKTSEWAYVLSGSTQVTSVDSEGRNFLATVGPGDLWFFPPGIPHSLQATNDSADGTEFLLVFDDGAFSEDATFLLTDWLAHVPYEVIQKNFQANADAFAHIPAAELYIFPGAAPDPHAVAPASPQGQVPNPYAFALSQVNATKLSGGSVKIVDSTTFTVATTIAAAEVTVEPGAIRELHWHPTMDEWSFFLEGEGRVTIFASQGNARTFSYQAGDIGFVPAAMGHYVENTGNTTLKYLEIFPSDRFQDISLNQWLALTPPELVKAHLGLSDDTIASLSKTKPVVVGPS